MARISNTEVTARFGDGATSPNQLNLPKTGSQQYANTRGAKTGRLYSIRPTHGVRPGVHPVVQLSSSSTLRFFPLRHVVVVASGADEEAEINGGVKFF